MKKINLYELEKLNSADLGKVLAEILKTLKLEVYLDANEWDRDFYLRPESYSDDNSNY